MPGKGKRVASRQAQLNRRRRRQTRSASEGGAQTAVEEGSAVATRVAPPAAAAATTDAPSAAAAPVNPQPAPAAIRPTGASSSQGRNAQPMAYTHLKGELRRVLTLAGIVTAVLISVSFFV